MKPNIWTNEYQSNLHYFCIVWLLEKIEYLLNAFYALIVSNICFYSVSGMSAA